MPTSWSRPSTRVWTWPVGTAGSIDRMVEVKVSWDPDPGLALVEHPVLGAPVALSGRAEALDPQPGGDGARRGRAADRAGGPALGRGLSSRGRRRGAADVLRPRFRPPRCAWARDDQERFPVDPSPSRCCRGCASSCRRGVDGAGRDSAHDGQRWLGGQKCSAWHNADGETPRRDALVSSGICSAASSASRATSPTRRCAASGSGIFSSRASRCTAAGGAPQRDPCRGRPRRAFGSPSGGVCRRRSRSGPRRAPV